MHIAIVTAGGAGMFCGSCMHDNTWARALQNAGVEVSLLPTYTPIRVDEPDVSSERVFFGGINVYLEYRWRFWRSLPRWLTRWLDRPSIINLATKFGVSNDAHQLGALTLAMLEGETGPQRTDILELAHFLERLSPDVVVFSNALLSGALKELKRRCGGLVYCTLQGDDIFLEALDEPYRSKAIAKISENAARFDGFLTHSGFYADAMSDYFSLPRERFELVPLGIDFAGHDGSPKENETFTIGYFARICPEKGLHNLLAAFRGLHAKYPHVRLKAGGFCAKENRAYLEGIIADASDLGEVFEYVGSPDDLPAKVEFFKSLDVLSVPTDYREPKGLYVLEAWANGVPVVQPAHGAFPEMIEKTGGGLLYEPGSTDELAARLEELLTNRDLRLELARRGQQAVREHFNLELMASETLKLFQRKRERVAL